MGVKYAAAIVVGLAACSAGQTTVLVTISSSAGTVPLIALAVRATLTGQGGSWQPLATDAGEIPLPGTLLIRLPDEAPQVFVSAEGETGDGLALVASGMVRSRPHEQTSLELVLGAPPVGDGASPDDLSSTADAGSGSDGSTSSDAGASDARISDSGSDGNAASDGPAPPDLAQTTPPDLASGPFLVDTFQRADQASWGTASDGLVWSYTPNSSVLSIAGNSGIAANGLTNWSYYALLGNPIADVEVLFAASITGWNSTHNSVAALLRHGTGGFYYGGIDSNGTAVKIIKVAGGVYSTLANASFSAQANTVYQYRFRMVGSALWLKVWPASAAEPSGWTINGTDASPLPAGQCGLRLLPEIQTVTVTSFIATVH